MSDGEQLQHAHEPLREVLRPLSEVVYSLDKEIQQDLFVFGEVLIDKLQTANPDVPSLPFTYAAVVHHSLDDAMNGFDGITGQPLTDMRLTNLIGNEPSVRFGLEAGGVALAKNAYGERFAEQVQKQLWNEPHLSRDLLAVLMGMGWKIEENVAEAQAIPEKQVVTGGLLRRLAAGFKNHKER